MLSGKTIIVTGATKGIGKAVALKAAAMGANVVLGGRDLAAGEAVLKEIESNGTGSAIFVQGDLTDVANCKKTVDAAVERFGGLDGLVNYAGTVQASAALDVVTEEQFDWIMGVNFKSTFFITKYAVEAMREKGGSIVFMGSLHAYGGEADRPAYACSKGACHTLYKHVVRNYAKYGIRANWVTIGWVATPGEVEFRRQLGVDDAQYFDRMSAQIMPMGRLQKPEDYVDGVLYLLSDGASQTTGSEIFITGGFML